MQLQTKDQLMMDNTGIKEDHLRLHNYVVADEGFGQVWTKQGLKNRIRLQERT